MFQAQFKNIDEGFLLRYFWDKMNYAQFDQKMLY